MHILHINCNKVGFLLKNNKFEALFNGRRCSNTSLTAMQAVLYILDEYTTRLIA